MMPPKILICDDEQDVLSITSLILEDSGYGVIPIIDSLNVMDAINLEVPDLVLVDLWMPGISGDGILRKIRQQKNISKLPVIVFSASREGEAIAMSAGANCFIAKPFDLEYLLLMIGRFVK